MIFFSFFIYSGCSSNSIATSTVYLSAGKQFFPNSVLQSSERFDVSTSNDASLANVRIYTGAVDFKIHEDKLDRNNYCLQRRDRWLCSIRTIHFFRGWQLNLIRSPQRRTFRSHQFDFNSKINFRIWFIRLKRFKYN